MFVETTNPIVLDINGIPLDNILSTTQLLTALVAKFDMLYNCAVALLSTTAAALIVPVTCVMAFVNVCSHVAAAVPSIT